MPYEGVIIHQSVCSAINGKGYDFYITKEGGIIPASEATDPKYLHVCVEGDFSAPPVHDGGYVKQMFIATKVIQHLAYAFDLEAEDIRAHHEHCPGKYFPWEELVISLQDEYH